MFSKSVHEAPPAGGHLQQTLHGLLSKNFKIIWDFFILSSGFKENITSKVKISIFSVSVVDDHERRFEDNFFSAYADWHIFLFCLNLFFHPLRRKKNKKQTLATEILQVCSLTTAVSGQTCKIVKKKKKV